MTAADSTSLSVPCALGPGDLDSWPSRSPSPGPLGLAGDLPVFIFSSIFFCPCDGKWFPSSHGGRGGGGWNLQKGNKQN